MKAALRPPPVDVPTLTEVVGPAELAVPVLMPEGAEGVGSVEHAIDDEVLARRILTGLQGPVDQLVLARLHERLLPLLDQVAAGLVEELAPLIHDAVRQAIAHELAKSRAR